MHDPEVRKTMALHPVIRAKQYNTHPSGVEVIEITEHLGGCFFNAVKYVLRHAHKDNPRQDLEKACWYLSRAENTWELQSNGFPGDAVKFKKLIAAYTDPIWCKTPSDDIVREFLLGVQVASGAQRFVDRERASYAVRLKYLHSAQRSVRLLMDTHAGVYVPTPHAPHPAVIQPELGITDATSA